MTSPLIFKPNVPQELTAESFPLREIAALNLQPGETFQVCLQPDGSWSVWLTPETEKARAQVELCNGSELEHQLQLSLEHVNGPGPRVQNIRPIPALSASQAEPQTLRPTGTSGPAPQPVLAPRKGRNGVGQIPYNIAFREVVHFVTEVLDEKREQWNDSARQDLVSTVLIAAAKQGILTVWER